MTNASGVIQYVSAPSSTTINGVATGNYLVYRVVYDSTQLPLPTLTVGTNITAIGGGCTKFTNQLAYKVCPSTTVSVSAKVFLSANYVSAASMMHDSLRVKGLIPSAQPFGSLFSYSGTETFNPSVTTVTGANAVVDWVLVELRSDTSTTVVRKAGLLQRDGDIVDMDGTTPLAFTAAPGNYYIVVKHRNHLGVMTGSKIALTSTPTTIDFTNPLTTNFQRFGAVGSPYAQRTIGSVRALWGGNAGGGTTVKGTGSGSDTESVLFKVLLDVGNTTIMPSYIMYNVYAREDTNMDGKLIYQGTGAEVDNILFNVLLHGGNANVVPTFIINEQVPN